MLHPTWKAQIATLWCVLVPAALWPRDLYVAPRGTPAGPGTLDQPFDLATALQSQVGQPGDTFWLQGGAYVIGHVVTKIAGAPDQRITFRLRVEPGRRV